jgi:CheY-like chemotaxis protein/CHASE3 domain sensor protein/HPt (histidine-containing phosphotransfer) domain-containing protein
MGIGGVLLVVAVIGWVSYQNTSTLMETASRIALTQQTLTALEVFLSQLTEAESSAQGEVIASGGRARESYRAALEGADRTLERLRHLVLDNANQQQRIGMLKSLLDEKAVLLQHAIEIQAAEGFHPELHTALGDRGQELLGQIRWLVETMKAEAWASLIRRNQLEKARWRMTSVIIPLGVGLSAVLLFLVLYLFRREIAEHSHLQAEWRQFKDAAEVAGHQQTEMPEARAPPLNSPPPAIVADVSMHGDPATSSSTPDQPLAARLPLQILVAEDNPVNQRMALHMLARMGYRADLASNGLEVLQALERQAYDVVFMDLQMPELDGLESTRRIREQWPGAARPRIIAMTANTTQEDREACIAAGMDDYINKPLRSEALQEALERCSETIRRQTGRDVGGLEASDEFAALSELRAMQQGEDHDIVTELIEMFLADTPARLDTLRHAIHRADPQALEQAGHSLKGSCAMIGAQRMADLCAELERLARVNAVERAEVVLGDLESEFVRTRHVLERQRQRS